MLITDWSGFDLHRSHSVSHAERERIIFHFLILFSFLPYKGNFLVICSVFPRKTPPACGWNELFFILDTIGPLTFNLWNKFLVRVHNFDLFTDISFFYWNGASVQMTEWGVRWYLWTCSTQLVQVVYSCCTWCKPYNSKCVLTYVWKKAAGGMLSPMFLFQLQ